jgi:hypothetical protein
MFRLQQRSVEGCSFFFQAKRVCRSEAKGRRKPIKYGIGVFCKRRHCAAKQLLPGAAAANKSS